MLHGRLPPDEKDATMNAFAAGELDVLVATTVVEVGVDVPNATVMVVMDADRFGVSQLHQLRGRVGRGSEPGLCLLVTASDPDSPARERLAAVAASTDGFELSRLDVEMRHEGDVLGARQSGVRSSLRLLSVVRHEDVIVDARDAVAGRRGRGPVPGRSPGARRRGARAGGDRAGRLPGADMTRIVAGQWGGRRLKTPKGDGTRPTSDRVREAMFSSLESELGGLDGCRVLDLFAGSGALGLEALSRGAGHADLRRVRPAGGVGHRPQHRGAGRDRGPRSIGRRSSASSATCRPNRTTSCSSTRPTPWAPTRSASCSRPSSRPAAFDPDGVVVVERSTRTPFTWPDGLTGSPGQGLRRDTPLVRSLT